MPTESIPITSTDEANRLLVENPLALLIGMLLDHKVRETSSRRAPSAGGSRVHGSSGSPP